MAAIEPISAAARAIEQRLRLYFPANLWGFEYVADPMTTVEFKRLLRVTPCLALSWRSLKADANPKRAFSGDLGFRLTLIAKNPSEGASRFFGDKRGPGLYPALTTAIAAVNGFTIKDVGTVFANGADPTYAEGFDDLSAAIAIVDLTIGISFDDLLNTAAEASDFLLLNVEWDVDPAENEPTDVVKPRSP